MLIREKILYLFSLCFINFIYLPTHWSKEAVLERLIPCNSPFSDVHCNKICKEVSFEYK